jgi:hypothetical protein
MFSVAPFTSHPYDMGAWITHQLRPFNAGLDPFFNWKYSAPMLAVLLTTHLPAIGTATLLHVPGILADQFWIKVPFIVCHLVSGVVLGRCVWHLTGRRSDARLASIIWLLNPVAIFFTAIHGQVDALPAALILVAILFFIQGSESNGLAAALGAAAAKYVGFVLVPFAVLRSLHRSDSRWVTLGKLTAACVLVVVAAFGPGILLDGGLVGGLRSSLVQGAQMSPWSIWSLFDDPESVYKAWTVLFLGWYAFVLWRFARSERATRDPLNLVRGVASTLAMLVALHPFANPQFIIWLMPLALVLAFVDRSAFRLGIIAVIGVLNLVTLFALVEPIAWFLNAVPDVHTAVFDADFLTGTFHPELARWTGAGYAVVLVAMAVADAMEIPIGLRITDGHSAVWRWAGRLSVAQGVAILLVFTWVVFQPALVNRYAEAPLYPVVLERVNSFPASRVNWTSDDQTTFRAEWPEVIRNFADGHQGRETVTLVARRPLLPVVSMTEASGPVAIGPSGLTQSVTLPSVARLMRVELLLGNPQFGLQGEPPLPIISMSSDGVPGREIEMTTSARYAVVPGWFLVRAEPEEDVLVDRTFMLEVTAPQRAGWIWNGGDVSVRRAGPYTGDRWIEVWAAPPGDDGLVLTDDHVLKQSHARGNSPLLGGFPIEVSKPLPLRPPPVVSLEVDIRRRGSLRPLLLMGIGTASLVVLFLFFQLTIAVTRWGTPRPDEIRYERARKGGLHAGEQG